MPAATTPFIPPAHSNHVRGSCQSYLRLLTNVRETTESERDTDSILRSLCPDHMVGVIESVVLLLHNPHARPTHGRQSRTVSTGFWDFKASRPNVDFRRVQVQDEVFSYNKGISFGDHFQRYFGPWEQLSCRMGCCKGVIEMAFMLWTVYLQCSTRQLCSRIACLSVWALVLFSADTPKKKQLLFDFEIAIATEKSQLA